MAQISQQFIEHIQKQLPESVPLDDLLSACQCPLRKSIRANLLKMSPQELRQEFESHGYKLLPIPWCEEGFWVDENKKALPENLGNWLPHLEGQCYIQEASSMLPVKALLHDFECHEDSAFLDMAAAPGSKTTQLTAQINNQGLVVANELSSSRLKGLHYNLQRCGVINSVLCHTDARHFGERTPEFFDAILLDAPCGGEGTVRKDEQALADWNIDAVRAISELQKDLIISAYKALKPGGRLVYSTCTLSKEENQEVCQHLLDLYGDTIRIKPLSGLFEGADKAITAEGYLHVYPNLYDCEGFFVACFEKQRSDVFSTDKISNPSSRFNFLPICDENYATASTYTSIFGWDISTINHQLWQKDNRGKSVEIWYLPKSTEKLCQHIKLNRYGIKLMEISKHGVKLNHQAAISFGDKFSQQRIELTAQQAEDYYQGKDIFLDSPVKAPNHKEFIVTNKQTPLGLVKHLGNKLKNNLPRDLVRDKSFNQLP